MDEIVEVRKQRDSIVLCIDNLNKNLVQYYFQRKHKKKAITLRKKP